MIDHMKIRGARVHNLKNIDVVMTATRPAVHLYP